MPVTSSLLILLKTKLLAFTLLLLALPAASQKLQSVLWQVAGNGLKQPSYLFGTVHTLPPALLDKFPVKRYMSEAQFGVFEMSGKPLAPVVPERNPAPERPQPPVDSLFSPHEYAVVDSFFSASPFGSLKGHDQDIDWQSMLYVVVRLKQGVDAQQAYFDESIADDMTRQGKPIFRLDTDDDPDITKVRTSYPGLAKAIVSLIREKSEGSYYVPGDPKGNYVAQLTADLKLGEEATGLGKELSVRRNLRWLPQLEQQMQQGGCFVAVGLGHLGFKTGLITLLRQRGYQLKPIKLPAAAPQVAPGAARRRVPRGQQRHL